MLTSTTPTDIDCIIAAAGLSSRMGRWKLILPYPTSCADSPNTTIVEQSVKNALALCTRVILVVGYRADELIATFAQHPNVKIVVNREYQQGMFGSIQRGVEHVRSEHFFIAHADMPCISEAIYQRVWQARAAGTVFPGDSEHSGHPVLINASLTTAILNQCAQGSMKAVLNRFPIRYLKLQDDNIHFDIDTPEAYQQMLKIL